MPRLTHIVTHSRSGITHKCITQYSIIPRCRRASWKFPGLFNWKPDYVVSLEGLRLCKLCWPKEVIDARTNIRRDSGQVH
jgi:hypothetical protein